MAFSHARRRGAALHFRRRIPLDLIQRFGSREIVRSIGRPTSGDARLILSRLWSKSELVFMYVRQHPSLSQDDVAKVAAAAFDQFDETVEEQIAILRPCPASHPLDEPIQMAARMAGTACVARDALDRCNIDAVIPLAQSLAQTVLGKSALSAAASGRLARGFLEGIDQGAEAAGERYALLAKRRPAKLTDLMELSEGEIDIETTPDFLATLRSLKKGETPKGLIDLAATDALRDFEPDERSSRHVIPTATWTTACSTHPATDPAVLKNADKPLSRLWDDFVGYKLSGKKWRKEEAAASQSTLRLLVALFGDRPARFYKADDMAALRSIYQKLPAKYAQENPWRTVYAQEGPRAVVEQSVGLILDRTTDKSWNKQLSRLSEFFAFAASPAGSALPENCRNPCQRLFIEIGENALSWEQEWERRRSYSTEEIQTLFSAPKFFGAQSASRWRTAGHNVVRDHRFWLTLIAFLHGVNRRRSLTPDRRPMLTPL